MKKLKRLWLNIPRRIRITANLLLILLLAFAVWVFCGCPAFTAEQRFRQLERTHMVGPARIIENYELEPENYLNMILADDGDGIIFYPYADYRHGTEAFYYREKTGDLTVLAAPILENFTYWEYKLDLPVFLFDKYPKAHRAQLQITLSETVNDEYFEKEYILDALRDEAGLFRFNIHAESGDWYIDDYGRNQGTPLGAEGAALQQFSRMCGYDDSFNLRPQPVTVRLYDKDDNLILEEEILVHCVAGQAHSEQGEEIPPKEHKKHIHRPSRWLSFNGHSPLFLAGRVKRVSTICQLRRDCYLRPVNGLVPGITNCSPSSSSFSWFAIYSAIRLSFFPTVST